MQEKVITSSTVSNINDVFFNGFYKDVWRKLIPVGISEAECAFIEKEASLQPGDKVLDLMCGYGRHTLPLAKRGYQLTSIDNSNEYIEEINKAAEGLSITTQAASLMEMQLEEAYDLAICMGNSFCFFSKEEAGTILQKVHQHLKASGYFIINTWMLGEIIIRHFKEKEWFYLDEYKYLIDNRYLFNPTRVEADHIIIRSDGATEVLKSVDYIFTVAEMRTLFEESGFQLKEIYSIPKRKKFELGDTQAYIIAERV